MKCQYRVNPDMMLELEGGNQKELFAAMAAAAEIFGKHWLMCGCCKDKNFKPMPVVRVNKEQQSFYELHCTNPACQSRLAFGQKKDMKSLFPQREYPKGHPQAGKLKPNGGWVKWDGKDVPADEEGDEPEKPAAPPQTKKAAK